MRYKTTLILAGVLIALAAYTYFVEVKGREGREKEKEKGGRVLSFEPQKVTELKMTYPGESIALVRYGENQWRLTYPLVTRGDSLVIGGLLTTLENIQVERTIGENGAEKDVEKEIELKEYGLDSPSITVVVSTSDSERPQTLLIGDPTPVGGQVYAKRGERDEVILLPAYAKGSLQKSVGTLREKRLFPDSKAEDVLNLTLRHFNPPLTLTKEGEKGWKLNGKEAPEIEGSKVENLVSRLVSLRADDFLPKIDRDIYGLRDPKLRFIWQEKGKKEIFELIVSQLGEKVYAGTNQSKELYQIAGYQFNDLNVDLAALKKIEVPKGKGKPESAGKEK